jgi:hypothetical protein
MQVSELRQQIADALIRCGRIPANTPARSLRLRDRFPYYTGKVLRDGLSLSDSMFYVSDNKTLTVTLLPEEEILPVEESGDVIVFVQRFHRSDWSLSQKLEVLLPGEWKVSEIAKGLAVLFEVPFESLRVLIVPRDSSFPLFELGDESPTHNYGRHWVDPTKEDKLQRYMTHELRLVEGDLLIVTCADESLGVLSAADRQSMCIVRGEQAKAQGCWDMDDVGSTMSKSTATTDYYNNYWGSNSPYKATSSVAHPSGIRIKTHKDRVKENEEKSKQSTDNNEHNESMAVGSVSTATDHDASELFGALS